jgi:hypothetical protein
MQDAGKWVRLTLRFDSQKKLHHVREDGPVVDLTLLVRCHRDQTQLWKWSILVLDLDALASGQTAASSSGTTQKP